MGNVKVIAANPNKARGLKGLVKKLLRVCAYCRVSTGTEEQKTSYESQIKYYKQKIKQNDEWELVDIYADEAISGTQVYKRINFKRMIDDALEGKIDLILVKSISRFGRNTVDILKYIRLLKEHNVAVYFEEENINTMKMQGEILLTVLSALAQQGSATISSSVALGARMKMKRGELVGHYAPYGYRYDDDIKNLVIYEEEAEVVREVFRLYVEEGMGTGRIARTLNNRHIPSPTGRTWSSTVITRMIRNEKYVGDLLTGKTYTEDPITKKKIINHGEREKYYTENHHPAIVSRAIWNKANSLLDKRSARNAGTNKVNKESQMYPFSSKIDCGCCGEKFIRRSWAARNGQPKRSAWACRTFQRRTDDYCENVGNVKEKIIEDAFVSAYNTVCDNHTVIINQLLKTMEEILSGNNYEKEVSKIREQIDKLKDRESKLVDMKLDGIIDGQVYVQKLEEVKNKILLYEEKLDEYKKVMKDENQIQKRIAEFKSIFKKNKKLKEFDAAVFKSVINNIIIGEKDENDNLDPNVIKFIFKNEKEVIQTLPPRANSQKTIIDKYVEQIKQQQEEAKKNNPEVAKTILEIEKEDVKNDIENDESVGAYCDTDKYSACNSKRINCFFRK